MRPIADIGGTLVWILKRYGDVYFALEFLAGAFSVVAKRTVASNYFDPIMNWDID